MSNDDARYIGLSFLSALALANECRGYVIIGSMDAVKRWLSYGDDGGTRMMNLVPALGLQFYQEDSWVGVAPMDKMDNRGIALNDMYWRE